MYTVVGNVYCKVVFSKLFSLKLCQGQSEPAIFILHSAASFVFSIVSHMKCYSGGGNGPSVPMLVGCILALLSYLLLQRAGRSKEITFKQFVSEYLTSGKVTPVCLSAIVLYYELLSCWDFPAFC